MKMKTLVSKNHPVDANMIDCKRTRVLSVYKYAIITFLVTFTS